MFVQWFYCMFCNFLSFRTFLFVSGWRIVPFGSLSFLSIPATVISFLTFLGDIYLLHCRQLIVRGLISAFRLANFIFLGLFGIELFGLFFKSFVYVSCSFGHLYSCI